MLTALPVVLLTIVTVWFLWPIVVDPITRAKARRTDSDADQMADQLFHLWAKHGRGTALMVRSERS